MINLRSVNLLIFSLYRSNVTSFTRMLAHFQTSVDYLNTYSNSVAFKRFYRQMKIKKKLGTNKGLLLCNLPCKSIYSTTAIHYIIRVSQHKKYFNIKKGGI